MINQDFITPNKYSRPGRRIVMGKETIMQHVIGIVMHWVENAGSTARDTGAWFERRKEGRTSYGSTHYGIDKLEIVQYIPESEIAYHVGAGPFPSERYTDASRNTFNAYPSARTIGIELHHPTEDGHFEDETLWRAVWLCVGICFRYGLDPLKQIYRHYDITGKVCPKYWVDEPDKFDLFKCDVHSVLAELNHFKRSA